MVAITLFVALLAVSCGDGASGGPVPLPPDGSGAGTPGNPFIVGSAASLLKVGTNSGGWGMDACYKQTADIILGGLWVPIGTFANPFTGTYDGGNNTIAGLTVSRAANYNGFFSYVDGGTIKGLRLTNVAIITGSNNYAGAVAGMITGGAMISNCSATGTISASYEAGGIAGYCVNDSIVEHCSSGVTVTGTGDYIGGVVGVNYGIVKYCSSSGAVKGHTYTGGVVGHIYGPGLVQNCYATGSVTATGNYTGGVVGLNDNGTVEYSYASGAVSGASRAGGIVGHNADNGTVRNCAALCASVTASADNAGRVAGLNTATVNDCFAFQYMDLSSVDSIHPENGSPVDSGQYSGQAWWQSGPPAGPGFSFGPWKWDSARMLPALK